MLFETSSFYLFGHKRYTQSNLANKIRYIHITCIGSAPGIELSTETFTVFDVDVAVFFVGYVKL